MKTMFTSVAIATLTLVGVAQAQTPAKDTTTTTTTTTTTKGADAKSGKADAKATTKTDTKAPDTKATDTKTAGTDAKKPEMPKVPSEVAEMAKSVVGTWKCKGDEWDQTGARGAVTAVNRSKVDMDKWWIVDNLEVKGKMPFKMVSYTTYDAGSKKWRRVGIDNWGGQMVGTSDGMKDGKMVWNMDMMGPMGAGMFRDSVDTTDAKAGVKFMGEMSMDKGKSWNKAYEMTCKK